MRAPRLVCATSLAGILLAGCASGPARPDAQLSAALDQLDAQNEYATTKRCLGTFEYDSVEILDDQHLLFEKGDKSVWLNKLRSRCPGLRADDILAFDMRSNRLCSLDSATVIDRFLLWRRSGPTCSLGEFQELTAPQASLLREAMKG
ncbi:MAG: DUF6491 family protein [Pseudomonadales bacterium]